MCVILKGKRVFYEIMKSRGYLSLSVEKHDESVRKCQSRKAQPTNNICVGEGDKTEACKDRA